MQNNSPGILGNAKVLASRLRYKYSPNESDSIAKTLVEYLSGQQWLEIRMNPQREFSPQQQLKFEEAAQRLETGEPLQYIIGVGWFYGREFEVSPAVLIPRRETEELVEWLLEPIKEDQPVRILDIGTGSGCIAITIALERHASSVQAIDLSEAALKVAQSNARRLQAQVTFATQDVLKASDHHFQNLDLIVSNPPYIIRSEEAELPQNVRDHEPPIALFVEDDDPLLYYRIIMERARSWLSPGGSLYFEINEAYGRQARDTMQQMGYEQVTLKQDLQGKDRMLKGRNPLKPAQGS